MAWSPRRRTLDVPLLQFFLRTPAEDFHERPIDQANQARRPITQPTAIQNATTGLGGNGYECAHGCTAEPPRSFIVRGAQLRNQGPLDRVLRQVGEFQRLC